MVKEVRYTSIKRVLDNLMEHPLLRDLTLEQVVRYTIRFIGIHGYSKFYEDKIETVDIDEFRGVLPCDLISIIQVKDLRTGVCMRSMTDNFANGMREDVRIDKFDRANKLDGRGSNIKAKDVIGGYIPPRLVYLEEPAFKTQGRVIYTSFPEGCVEIAYKSIPVDEDGFPKLLDNENYLACLEAYIKKTVFTMKFDTGKIAPGVLKNAQMDYAWLAGQLQAEMVMPSTSEMESISRMLGAMIPRVREFEKGFKEEGNREYIRRS